MKPTRKLRLVPLAAVALAATTWAPIGLAQGQRGAGAPQPPPIRFRVQVSQIKPEMVPAYQDLIKNDLLPALKKAGQTWQWAFTSGPVGQNFTYVTVSPVTNYAQFDQQPSPVAQALGPAGIANLGAKFRQTVASQQAYIDTLRQDLSIVSNSDTPPAIVVIQALQIAPGKGQEFTNVITTDWLPLFKKAGWKDVWFTNRTFGGPPGVAQIRFLSKYAELDEPGLLQKAGLTPEQIQALLARRNAVASVVNNEILRYVPDLSFGMPAMPRPTP